VFDRQQLTTRRSSEGTLPLIRRNGARRIDTLQQLSASHDRGADIFHLSVDVSPSKGEHRYFC
jgi:hypothetical protein